MYVRLVGIGLFMCCSALAQERSDSVLLAEVIVEGTIDKKFLAGSVLYPLDSTLKDAQPSQHLGEVLSFQFPIYFRNYGYGMLSGVSMRGTSPQHTAVLWNGVNIASFSLGQADFSMLPAIAFSNVEVHEGGGSARFGSGAFGGSVLLSSFEHRNRFSVSQEVASFKRYHTSASLSLARGQVNYSASIYHLQAENDFPIAGTDLTQDNAALRQYGTTQNIQFQLSPDKSVSLNYWYHDADRQIQPALGVVNNTDNQQDQNHRLLVGYAEKRGTSQLQIKTGWIDDEIVFRGNKSNVRRLLAVVNHQRVVREHWQLEISANGNHIIGNIEEYQGGQAIENRFEAAIAATRNWTKVSVAANLRQPFISNTSAPLLFYLGSDVVLFEKNSASLTTKINVSRNFRAPTLNDRYWGDAGNPDLSSEKSYASEMGVALNTSYWKVEQSLFGQRVDDWIQWKPIGENGEFVPRNLLQVRVTGFQSLVEYKRKFKRGSIRTRVSHQLVNSIVAKAAPGEEATIGKQLIYTPRHVGSAILSVRHRSWTLLVAGQATDLRYTDDLNNKRYELAAHSLVDVSLGKCFDVKKHQLVLQLSVKNAGDTTYQLYVARAQPQRHYSIQINYQLIPTSK